MLDIIAGIDCAGRCKCSLPGGCTLVMRNLSPLGAHCLLSVCSTALLQMAKRRLSVAPQLAGLSALTGSPLLDNKEDANLTPLELQAKGKLKHSMVSRKGLVPYNKNKGQYATASSTVRACDGLTARARKTA
jgi:hypothetical protein